MDAFAQRLTLLRENKNLKKKELATILNVSSACISQYESGDTMPSPILLILIAQYFEVSVDFLLANEPAEWDLDLSGSFAGKTTYYELLDNCRRLSPKARLALLSVLDALREDSSKE